MGIGAAWNEEECDAYGINLGTLTERFDRFAEACEVIKGLLTAGAHQLRGPLLHPRRGPQQPARRPEAPTRRSCIGGKGERRTLPLVARYADHWNCPVWNCPVSEVDEFRAKRDVLHEACAAIGRDPAEIMTSVHVTVPADGDPAPVVEQAAAFGEAGVDLAICYLPPPQTPAVLEPPRRGPDPPGRLTANSPLASVVMFVVCRLAFTGSFATG